MAGFYVGKTCQNDVRYEISFLGIMKSHNAEKVLFEDNYRANNKKVVVKNHGVEMWLT